MSDAVVHLSSVAGSPLLDSSGAKLGRVQDVVVRLDGRDVLPLVSGLKARIGGREMFVPADRIDRLEVAAARTSTTKLNLAQFERRPGEVLLRDDVLGHSLINVDTARLVVAREVELTCSDGVWRVAGIDPSLGGEAAAAAAAALPRAPGRGSGARRVDAPGAVRGARPELAPAPHPPTPGTAPRRPDRGPRRGRLPRGGRGDHERGGRRQGARGGHLRGARRGAPARVPARALRRAGGGRARPDGVRRRRGPADGARPGPPPTGARTAPAAQAHQGQAAARATTRRRPAGS